jgi:hypothetical protein
MYWVRWLMCRSDGDGLHDPSSTTLLSSRESESTGFFFDGFLFDGFCLRERWITDDSSRKRCEGLPNRSESFVTGCLLIRILGFSGIRPESQAGIWEEVAAMTFFVAILCLRT